MCIILDKISENTFEGYKVSERYNGRYYSVSTDYIYKVGKCSNLKRNRYRCKGNKEFSRDHFDKGGAVYNTNYIGKTAVFKKLEDANKFLKKIRLYTDEKFKDRLCILKMKISGDLYNGGFFISAYSDVVIGDTIVFFEELTD